MSEGSTATYMEVEVSGGSLEREIIVSFSTSDSTAIGTHFDQLRMNKTDFANHNFILAGEDYAGLTIATL